VKTPNQASLILPHTVLDDAKTNEDMRAISTWSQSQVFPIVWRSGQLAENWAYNASVAVNMQHVIIAGKSNDSHMVIYKQKDWSWLAVDGYIEHYRYLTTGNASINFYIFLRPYGFTPSLGDGIKIGSAWSDRLSPVTSFVGGGYLRWHTPFCSGPIRSLNDTGQAINGIWLPAGRYDCSVKVKVTNFSGNDFGIGASDAGIQADKMAFTITEYPPTPSIGGI